MKTKYLLYTMLIWMLPILCIAQAEQNTHLPKLLQGLKPADMVALKADLEAFLKEKHIPGAMITIVTKDSTFFVEGIGLANMETQEPVTEHHLFRLGSISKSVTALGLINLLKETGYSLHTPIRELVPSSSFSNRWADETPITIEHLLEHTAGFDDFHLHAMYNRTGGARPSGEEMVLSHRNSYDVRWKPGVKKAYSNPGYIMAGYIMELLANESYYQYLNKSILDPLEMHASRYFFTQPEEVPFAQGYRYTGGGHESVGFPSIEGGPAGGFSSNAVEMAHLLKFLLNRKANQLDTAVFTDEVFDRIENANTTLAAKAGLPGDYGYGNYTIWKHGYQFHGHDGGIDGFSSRYLYSREADIGVSVAINRQGNATEIAHRILDFFLEAEDKTPNRKIAPIPFSLKESHEGFYRFSNPKQALLGFTDRMFAGLILDFQEDKILVKKMLGKTRDTLYHAGDNQFYKNNETVPSTMLLLSEEGDPVFWINESYTEMESRAYRLTSGLIIALSMILPFVFLAYSIIWFVIRRFSKFKKPTKHHLVLGGSCLCYALMLVSLGWAMSDPFTAGTMSAPSLLLFVSSLLLVPSVVITIIHWFKPYYAKGFRFYYLLTSSALLVMMLFFMQIGFIGLRLWAY